MPIGKHEVTDIRNTAGLATTVIKFEEEADDTKILGNIFFFNKVSYF